MFAVNAGKHMRIPVRISPHLESDRCTHPSTPRRTRGQNIGSQSTLTDEPPRSISVASCLPIEAVDAVAGRHHGDIGTSTCSSARRQVR